jgi:hypothetical protein
MHQSVDTLQASRLQNQSATQLANYQQRINHTLHCSTTAQFSNPVAYLCINLLILCRLQKQLATQLANYQQRINHTLHCSTTAQFSNHVAYVCINPLILCRLQKQLATHAPCQLPAAHEPHPALLHHSPVW